MSLALNAGGAVAVARRAHVNGGVGNYLTQKAGLRKPAPVDFSAEAEKRFGLLPIAAGDVVFAGDSHIQNAPLADLAPGAKQRGIGGQTVDDMASWIGLLLQRPIARLVLLVGTNDVLQGHDPAAVARDYGSLLDRVKQAQPSTDVVVMAVPPLRDGNSLVPDVNDALRDLAARRGVRFADLFTALADTQDRLPENLTADGTHLSPAGYAQAAATFRQAARARP